MEKEEKIQYGVMLFVSILVFTERLLDFTYTKGLAVDENIHNIDLLLTLILLILLGLALILIALDFIVAGVVPDAVITIVTWVYVLLLGVLILVMAVLNYLKI